MKIKVIELLCGEEGWGVRPVVNDVKTLMGKTDKTGSIADDTSSNLCHDFASCAVEQSCVFEDLHS